MKKILAAMTAALMMVALAGSALAAPPTTSLMGQAWKVYNVKPATSSFWDINKVKLDASGLTFPIQQFQSKTTGSFAVYLLNNYNKDITGQTLSAEMNWTSGTYETRSTVSPGAYVRFEFQDVTAGPYNSNDYWWSTGTTNLNIVLDLNAVTSGTLTASLSDCTLWSNQNGLSACDTTTVNWTDWQGNLIAESPAVGFANAMKNVKQLGLSFGSSGTYASGVARDGGAGIFTVSAFTVTP
jgi:hypothetical protein